MPSDNIIDWTTVVPEHVMEWFLKFATGNRIPPKLLLSSMLACTSALVRSSTIEYPIGFKEGANLYMICLAPSGAGKTPAHNMACVGPCEVVEDENEEVPLTLGHVTENGLYETLDSVGEHVTPILAVDECYRLLTDVLGSKKNALSIDVLCKLHDGYSWKSTKGTKAKRRKLKNARISTLLFTTPNRFLDDIWKKMVDNEDGLSARFLVTYAEKESKTIQVSLKCIKILHYIIFFVSTVPRIH